jgi:Membrane protein involved in the export of O-antigen and teichoic acid
MVESLKSQTIKGILWSGVEIFGQQLVGFTVGVLVARRLSPSDYGLVGMLAIFSAIAGMFINSGFSTALIQKVDATEKDYSSVFIFNIGLSVFLYSILFFASPWIAAFYSRPELTRIARAAFLVMVINSAGIIQIVIATKKINFKLQARITMISVSVSGIIGIVLAYSGYNYWTIVLQQISFAVMQTSLFWLWGGWRPSWIFDISSIKKLFGFSSKLLASALIDTIFVNMYGLIIGKIYSAIELGYYLQAEKIKNVPVNTLNSVIQRVTFPILSRIQDDNDRLKLNYRKIVKMVVFLNFSALLLLVAVATPLFRVLLTDKWLQSVPLFQWLCVAGLGWGLSGINLNILQVKGRSDIFLGLEIAKKTILVIALFFTVRFGALGMVKGLVFAMVVSVILNLYYSGKIIKYGLGEQLMDILPYIFVTVLASSIAWGIKFFVANAFVLLIVQISIGGLLIFCLSKLFKLEAFLEILNIAKGQFHELKAKVM